MPPQKLLQRAAAGQAPVDAAGKQDNARRGRKRQLQSDIQKRPRVLRQQNEQRRTDGRRRVIFPPHERRTQKQRLHHARTHGGRRRAGHKDEKHDHRDPERRREPVVPAAEQQHHAQKNGHMHTGHGDGMIDPGDGQLIPFCIRQRRLIAQQQCLQKSRGIRRKSRTDRRPEPFSQQSRP